MTTEQRFEAVFRHLGAVTAYAQRRGSRDADALAAEVMTIAWRRLANVPKDDPLPWVYATEGNRVLAERRTPAARGELPDVAADDVEPVSLHAVVDRAVRALVAADRVAILLVAWED